MIRNWLDPVKIIVQELMVMGLSTITTVKVMKRRKTKVKQKFNSKDVGVTGIIMFILTTFKDQIGRVIDAIAILIGG